MEITGHASLQDQLIKVLKSRRAMGFVMMPQRIASKI